MVQAAIESVGSRLDFHANFSAIDMPEFTYRSNKLMMCG